MMDLLRTQLIRQWICCLICRPISMLCRFVRDNEWVWLINGSVVVYRNVMWQ